MKIDKLQANIHIYDLRNHHEARYMNNLTIKRRVPHTQFAWLNKWSIWYSIVLDLLSGVEKQALSTKLPRMDKSHSFSLLIEPSVARQIKRQGQTITIEKKFLVEETDGYSAGRFSLNVTTAASTCRWTDLKINLIVKIKMLTYFTLLLICIMQPVTRDVLNLILNLLTMQSTEIRSLLKSLCINDIMRIIVVLN